MNERQFGDPNLDVHPPGTLLTFLEVVCLREHVAMLAPGARRPFVEAVAAAMPEPVIDYVRLKLIARRC